MWVAPLRGHPWRHRGGICAGIDVFPPSTRENSPGRLAPATASANGPHCWQVAYYVPAVRTGRCTRHGSLMSFLIGPDGQASEATIEDLDEYGRRRLTRVITK